jgi:hypothetical protein
MSAINYKLDTNNHLTASGAIGSETWAFEKRIAILNPPKICAKHDQISTG